MNFKLNKSLRHAAVDTFFRADHKYLILLDLETLSIYISLLDITGCFCTEIQISRKHAIRVC